MSLWRTLTSGLNTLFRRREFERDLNDEVEHFVEQSAREYMRKGLSRTEAERAARAAIGGAEHAKERARGGGWEFALDSFLRDMRYGARSLVRNPVFSLAAIVTLAVGVGGNTLVFSLVNAILLRPPAHVRAPDELVSIFTSDYSGPPYGSSSFPDFEEYRKLGNLFAGMTATAPRPVGIGEGDDFQPDGMEMVTDDYFRVLGVEPAVGRFFLPDEGKVGAPVAVTVLSHRLWQQRFGADRSIIGRTIRLDGRSFTVVGVAPAGYAGTLRGLDVAVWIPLAAGPLLGVPNEELTNRGSRSLMVIGRLATGVSLPQASAGLATLAQSLTAAYPDWWRDVSKKGRRITVVAERDARVPPQVHGPVIGFVALLGGTMFLVLLVCCANVAGLMLARATRRSHEMGVRVSLGASRGRVARQLLTESVMLSAAGALLGAAASVAAARALFAIDLPIPVRVGLDLSVDGRVLGFTAAIAMLTAVLFGVVPALRASRVRVTGMLKGETTGTVIRGRRVSLQGVLVAGQMAMSVLLLAGALLFVRSLLAASRIDPGFAVENVLLFDASPRPDFPRDTDFAATAERVRQHLAGLPGVVSASWGSTAPLALDPSRRSVAVDGYHPQTGEDMEFHYNVVGPAYFETMQLRMAAGRPLADADRQGAPPVVVVNETFARRFWPGASALGKRLSVSGPEGPWLEVVGVARDSRYLTLTEDGRPFLFLPALQVGERRDPRIVMHVRTRVEANSLRDAVRRDVATMAPNWHLTSLRTMQQQVGVSLAPQRVASSVLSIFGAVALLLAGVGLYGIVAYSVASRRREIGVRIALGARRQALVALVVRQGLRLAGWGLLIGLPAAWAVSRLLGAFLIGADAANGWTFAGVTVLLTAVALLASWIPARRAAALHPMIALRDE